MRMHCCEDAWSWFYSRNFKYDWYADATRGYSGWEVKKWVLMVRGFKISVRRYVPLVEKVYTAKNKRKKRIFVGGLTFYFKPQQGIFDKKTGLVYLMWLIIWDKWETTEPFSRSVLWKFEWFLNAVCLCSVDCTVLSSPRGSRVYAMAHARAHTHKHTHD